MRSRRAVHFQSIFHTHQYRIKYRIMYFDQQHFICILLIVADPLHQILNDDNNTNITATVITKCQSPICMELSLYGLILGHLLICLGSLSLTHTCIPNFNGSWDKDPEGEKYWVHNLLHVIDYTCWGWNYSMLIKRCAVRQATVNKAPVVSCIFLTIDPSILTTLNSQSTLTEVTKLCIIDVRAFRCMKWFLSDG